MPVRSHQTRKQKAATTLSPKRLRKGYCQPSGAWWKNAETQLQGLLQSLQKLVAEFTLREQQQAVPSRSVRCMHGLIRKRRLSRIPQIRVKERQKGQARALRPKRPERAPRPAQLLRNAFLPDAIISVTAARQALEVGTAPKGSVVTCAEPAVLDLRRKPCQFAWN